MSSPSITEILVCQSGSCRRRGSEAVLLEIEDLVRNLGNDDDASHHYRVNRKGCLGLCNQSPSVAVVVHENRNDRSDKSNGKKVKIKYRHKRPQQRGDVRYFTKVNSWEDSVGVVAAATGRDVGALLKQQRQQPQSSVGRLVRQRQQAVSCYRWNQALAATRQHCQAVATASQSSKQQQQQLNVLANVYGTLLTQAGFASSVSTCTSIEQLFQVQPQGAPTAIADYRQWTVKSWKLVSQHSAILSLRCRHRERNPSSSFKRETWHTTLLAMVGHNDEGPLPWIERDYTPITSAKDWWEKGKCDLLVKFYVPDGAATSWLYRQLQQECNERLSVWLSRPIPTLRVPSLTPPGQESSSSNRSNMPASLLLLLAGTGVVALSQVAHHRRRRLKGIPVDLILSCRSDDVLLLPEIVQFCQQAVEQQQQSNGKNEDWDPTAAHVNKGIRNFRLLLTGGQLSQPPPEAPFSNQMNHHHHQITADYIEQLEALPNAQVLRPTPIQTHTQAQALQARLLNQPLMQAAVANMPQPCRVLISGPAGFNAAAQQLLAGLVYSDAITVLEA